MITQTVSKQTQKNWWVDAMLFSSAIIAALSGIYFLIIPSGGYRGGQNSLYNVQALFTRQTWDDLHTWGGVAMIAVALVHLVIHWPWVASMARRTFNEITGKGAHMNARGRWNLILNLVVGLSFIITALTGVYFLFFPGGRGAVYPLILFTRSTWDLIHTWASATLIIAAVTHLTIHWKWVTKVTSKMLAMVPGFRRVSHSIPAIKS
jgi:hypothetical protein